MAIWIIRLRHYQARNSTFNVTNSDRITVYIRLQFTCCTQLNTTTVLQTQAHTVILFRYCTEQSYCSTAMPSNHPEYYRNLSIELLEAISMPLLNNISQHPTGPYNFLKGKQKHKIKVGCLLCRSTSDTHARQIAIKLHCSPN